MSIKHYRVWIRDLYFINYFINSFMKPVTTPVVNDMTSFMWRCWFHHQGLLQVQTEQPQINPTQANYRIKLLNFVPMAQ